MTDWLIALLSDWLPDCLNDWLPACLNGRLISLLSACLTDWLIAWLSEWLTDFNAPSTFSYRLSCFIIPSIAVQTVQSADCPHPINIQHFCLNFMKRTGLLGHVVISFFFFCSGGSRFKFWLPTFFVLFLHPSKYILLQYFELSLLHPLHFIVHSLSYHSPFILSFTVYRVIHRLSYHSPFFLSFTFYPVIHRLSYHSPFILSFTFYPVIHLLSCHSPFILSFTVYPILHRLSYPSPLYHSNLKLFK